MPNECAHDTDHKGSQQGGHPSVFDAMAGMMERCGCDPKMAEMMAACLGARGPDDAATENGINEEDGPPKCTAQGNRNG